MEEKVRRRRGRRRKRRRRSEGGGGGINIMKANSRTDWQTGSNNSYQLASWLEGVHDTAYDTPCHRHHRTISYPAKQIV